MNHPKVCSLEQISCIPRTYTNRLTYKQEIHWEAFQDKIEIYLQSKKTNI